MRSVPLGLGPKADSTVESTLSACLTTLLAQLSTDKNKGEIAALVFEWKGPGSDSGEPAPSR